MMNRFFWCDMSLAGHMLRQGGVANGEHIRLILPEESQRIWLQRLLPEQGAAMEGEAWQVWLETETASVQAGTPVFLDRVGIILRQRGVMANLSLRENLLLPFLYRSDAQALLQAEEELPEIAAFLGFTEVLERQAGECSSHTHRLISLGRCLLQKPAVIVAQDLDEGIASEHLSRFRALFAEAIARLRSGLLYLSASEQEMEGIRFDRSLTVAL